MDKQDVPKCQAKMLECLKYIDGICRENNLKYFLFFGTLLGAVRHKGFIPWDFDTDILMPRADAEKLLSIVEKQGGKYGVFRIENSIGNCNRVLIKNVICASNEKKDYFEENACVDIFIYDYAKPLTSAQSKKATRKIMKKYHALLYKEGWPMYTRENKIKTLLKDAYYSISALRYPGLTRQKMHEYFDAVAVSKVPTENFIILVFHTLNIFTFSKDVFENAEYVPFEDTYLPVPAGKYATECLERFYGNWQQLPPEDKRYPANFEQWVYKEL